MDQPIRTPRRTPSGPRPGRLGLLLPALAFTVLLTAAGPVSRPDPGRGPAPADASAAGRDAVRAVAARAMAAVLVATKTDNRAAGDAVPGGATINYTVTLANTGNADATNVSFSDTIDPNTTLAGAIRVSPLAFPDSYGFLSGSTLTVMAGTGLRANDFGGAPDAPVTAFSLDDFATSNAAGTTATVGADGALTVNADGSFTFQPPTGFVGAFTFDYRLTNTAGTDTAEVTLTAAPPVAPTAADDGPAPNSAPGDAYHTPLDTPFALAAPGVLTNDGLGTPTASLTSFGGGSLGGTVTDNAAGSNVALGGGGSLTVGADGAVAFTPSAGFTGLFTFQYRLTNAAGTSDATVTIAVGTRPAAADDVYPYVLVGNVGIDTATSTGFSVASNDAGDGATLTLTSTSNGTAVLDPSGTFTFEPAPGYEGPAGFTYDRTNGFGTVSATVSLSVSGMIWFIDNEAPVGVGTLTSPFASVADFNAVNDGVGNHPEAGDHVFLYERAAPYAGPITLLNGQTLVGQDATANLDDIAGVAPPPDSPALPVSNAANATTATLGGPSGVVVAQNNALYGFTAAPTGGAGISGAGFGTLTVDDVTVNATGGAALDLTNGALDAVFDAVSSTGGTHGVTLTNVGGTADLGTGAIAGSTTAGFLVSGGAATLTYAGSITNAAGRSVSATGRTGGSLTLAGPIADTGTGVLVQNNAGGAVVFAGSPVAVTTTGTDRGVTLASNTGSTVTFSGGGLAVATDDGNGFDATGGGFVVVSGAGNAVTSTGGVALNVANTTIGGAGLTFQRVSADGGPNGIVLIDTGVAGGLTVTGAGTAGSGGTIQNVAGADGAAAGNGVYLSGTQGVSLSRMDLSGTANNGVFGTGVRGLALDRVRFTGTHGSTASGAFAESAVHLVDAGGAVAVTNSRLDGGAYNALRVSNTTGSAPTLDSLVVAGDTVSTMQGSVIDPRDSALRVLIGDGTADVRVRNNVVSYWWANAVYVTAQGTGSVTARITGNTAHQTSGALAGAGGLWVNGGSLAFEISGNSVRGTNGTAISADRSATGPLMEGTIANNAVGASGVPNSGSASGIGIFASHHGTGTTTVRIDGNTIRQINGSANGAITTVTGDAATFGGSGTMNATISGNDIRESGTTVSAAQHAILVTHGVTAAPPGDADIGCYDIVGNTVLNFNSGSAATAQNRLRVNQRFNTTSRFPGYTGPATGGASATALAAYLLGRNTASNATNANSSTGGFLDTVPPGSPCPQPSALRFAMNEAAPTAPTAATAAPDLLGAARTAPLDRLAGREVAPMLVGERPDAGLTASADPREAARMAAEAASTPPASLLPPEVEVAIGTLPAGKSVTILFDVTVNSPVPPATTHLSNQGTATADGGLSVVTNDPDTPAPNDPTLTLLSHDTAGPVTSGVTVTPNPALINTALVVTANVSDATTGGSTIASAAYSVNGGAYQPMAAADGAYDEVAEDVTAAVPAFATAGVRQVCVRGTDAAGNTGAPSCVTLAVYNPGAGHVTGSGWFNSPAGAYVANPGFTGKSHLTFQAQYPSGGTVPTGQTRFWLQGQSFTFESTSYDWLVIAGARLQIQGSGTVNGAGSYGFMLTAIDGGAPGGGGVDRFRIRIWNKNAGNAVVYDNQVGAGCTDQSDTATPCTIHTHGSIQIHSNGGGNGHRGGDGEPAPETFSLQPPAPNPSHGQAYFRFGLPEAASVRIVVYDALGREVTRLADADLEAGWHVVTLDGLHLPSGAYFARMTAGTFAETQRFTIVR